MSNASAEAAAPAKSSATPKLTPLMLNHAAWATNDVATAAEFYTKVMGMESPARSSATTCSRLDARSRTSICSSA